MCRELRHQAVDLVHENFNKTFIVEGESYNMWLLGWTFEWSNKKNSFGTCHPRGKIIKLSKWLVDNSSKSLAEWSDTILHEIAHAIDFERRGTSDHSSTWRRIAISIGCDGKRCSSASIRPENSKYTLTCKNCGEKSASHKRRRVRAACTKCCNQYNDGRFSYDYELIQTLNIKTKTSNAVSKASIPDSNLSLNERIIDALKAEAFKRGYTYRYLSEKFNVSQAKVLNLRREHIGL